MVSIMRKSEVLSHFGTQQKVADALGISQRAVSGWDDVIPMGRALQLEKVTRGKLKADLAVYDRRPEGRPQ